MSRITEIELESLVKQAEIEATTIVRINAAIEELQQEISGLKNSKSFKIEDLRMKKERIQTFLELCQNRNGRVQQN
ncbi:hypothetical protein C1645_757433, partial [Glomus cerebriforme]